jgi:hypothetical protein
MGSKTFLYLITCKFENNFFIKIGKSRNLENRVKNIQTGCPHKINRVFVIHSEYDEEINGVEKYLHFKFDECRINGEWYLGEKSFIKRLVSEFEKINSGGFSWEEINELSDFIHFDSVEILLHHHDYQFIEVKKIKGKFSNYLEYNFEDFKTALMTET